MQDAENNTYRTIAIGNFTWMAENMATTKAKDNSDVSCDTDYSADATIIAEAGCRYSWFDAFRVCPSGWHVATELEFKDLISVVGSNDFERSQNLRALSWDYGKDKYAFSANIDQIWTDSEVNYQFAYAFIINNNSVYFNSLNKYAPNFVRCVQDYAEKCGEYGVWNGSACSCSIHHSGLYCAECFADWQGPDCGTWGGITMQDSDNKTYRAVTIGELTWMAENLATHKDLNGGSTVTCRTNAADQDFETKYGCLYNWDDANRVCPAGWHLPTAKEFEHLWNQGSGSSIVEKLAALRARDWGNNSPGTDLFAFTALPAGYFDSADYYIDSTAAFWTSTSDEAASLPQAFNYMLAAQYINTASQDKKVKSSVRCVKDYSCGDGGMWSNETGCVCDSYSSSGLVCE